MSGPDPDEIPRPRRIIAYAIVVAVLVLWSAVGSITVEVPPSWPDTFTGWLLLLFGVGLLLLVAIATPFIPEIARRVARVLARLPDWLRRRRADLRRPRRVVVGILALAVVVTSATLVRTPASALDLEPGEITILSAFDESPSDPRRILIDQWNQAHPENEVIIVDAPGEPDEQHDRIVDDAKPGGAHQADVYVLDNVWMPEFIRRNYIRPLDEDLRAGAGIGDSDFLRNVLDTCRGLDEDSLGLWCLPLNADAGLLFYRSDLPGVQEPTSWDDYSGDSAKKTLEQVRSSPAGVATVPEAATAAQFADEEILTVNALEAIWTAGGEVVNRDGQLVFAKDGSVEFDAQAEEALVNLSAALGDREITLADSETADEDASIAAFADGRAIFMRNWPVTYDKLTNPSDQDPISLRVTELAGPSVLGGQNLAISSSSTKPRAAQALIHFLTSSASQLILFEIGGFAPTRPEVYANASDTSRPYAQDLRSAVEGARPRPLTPCYIDFSRVFREGVLRALRNRGQLEAGFPRELASTVQDCD